MTLAPTRARTAVVTGAARGIGLATAIRLAADGHRVLLVDRDEAALAAAAARIPGSAAYACDITDRSEPDGAFAAAMDAFGSVDILVNNAGIAGRTAILELQTDDDWDRAIAVMLTAPFRWCRAAVVPMKASGWGRIINVSSVAGKEGNPNILPYSAAKAGLIGFTKGLAKETATHGILVNAVAPAVIATDLLLDVAPSMVEYMVSRIPLGRPGRPEEVAAAISWLASDESTFTTGQTLDLSGGRCTY
jgi:NAD(P)-dependent dehydrogenase (short-subunit alcohol dehydrogenase family)